MTKKNLKDKIIQFVQTCTESFMMQHFLSSPSSHFSCCCSTLTYTHTEMCHIVIQQYVAVVLFSKWLVFKTVCVWIEASVSFKKGCSVHITFLSFTTTEKLCTCFVWIQRGLRFQSLFKGMWLVYAMLFLCVTCALLLWFYTMFENKCLERT